MRLRAAVTLVPTVSALLVLAAGPATATAPTYGQLVYVHDDATVDYHLATVNTDGSGERPLDTQAAITAPTGSGKTQLEHMPEFSPSGAFLAFEGRDSDGSPAVEVQSTSTGAVSVLVDDPALVEGPTGWYADAGGLHLTFVRARASEPDALDAWEVPVSEQGAAGVPRQLTAFPGSLMNTVVVGSTMVFDYGSSHSARDHRICTSPLPAAGTTSSMTCLTSGYDDRRPSVNRAGDIVFARYGTPQASLVVLRGTPGSWTASTKKNMVTLSLPRTLKRVDAPRYSPDGGRIAFTAATSYSADDDDIYVVSAAGGTPQRVTKAPGQDGTATWRLPS